MLSAIDKRWWALLILCLGDLMIILDTTIVNVALPSIKADLGFTESSLVWVVNAYILAFSGFLLLGGRLGDLYGHRRIFLAGLALFTLASLACGLAQSQLMLIAARALQGFGGAIVAAIALSIIVTLFTEPAQRARAMGLFGFIGAGGGALGVLVGGFLTNSFDWHWNFLINIPIGLAVFAFAFYLVPESEGQKVKLDITGAATITLSLMLAVYAIVNGSAAGWLSMETLGLLVLAAALFGAFVYTERRVDAPLVPFHIFRIRNVAPSSIVGILWSAGMFSSFFMTALYLQAILGYNPLQVGLTFLPANLIMMAFSLGLSAHIVMRYGIKTPLSLGMAILALGLGWFAFAPADAVFALHILPGTILIGIGAGLAFNPILLAATNDVPRDESGLASGVLNTAFMMGGSLGLAILASIAALRTESLALSGADQAAALLAGYHASFFLASLFVAAAALVSIVAIRAGSPSSDTGTTVVH